MTMGLLGQANRSFYANRRIRCLIPNRIFVRAFSVLDRDRNPLKSKRYHMHQCREHSSRSFQLDALPFTVSPEAALDKFYKWADKDQGLYFYSNVHIAAVFVPVWSFDLNLRFVVKDPLTGHKTFDKKPSAFSIYGNESVVHVPGLSAYAGHSYRRSLVNPIVNTTLVFLGDKTQPFGKWMLRDMKFNDTTLQIFPDPWNATRGRALGVVIEELEAIAKETDAQMKVQVEVLKGRRVYMPTYVIDYTVLGANYRAFASGCDDGIGISGPRHKIWETSKEVDATGSFLYKGLLTTLRTADGPRVLLLVLARLVKPIMLLLTRIPLIGGIAAVVFSYLKFFQPWWRERQDTVEWERQRDREAAMDDRYDFVDHFVDSGTAKRFFESNRARILRHLSGAHERQQGDFDWYSQWEEWARQQWEKQQAQQQQYGYSQKQQEKTYTRKAKAKQEYQWEFEPNDPYSVLGVSRMASKEEISKAFRREMLKWHPDTQVNATEAEKNRALERSKLITEAYRKLRGK